MMETIKIDNEVVRVSDLPNEMQSVVALYEEALEQELQARKDLGLREAARLELTRRIVMGYREIKASAAEAMEQSTGDVINEPESITTE